MTEMPEDLFVRLNLGHLVVDATNGKVIPSSEHHFFSYWLVDELQTVMNTPE
jgi:hypothetical protein